MALEDDLRTTIREAREFYKNKATAMSGFLADWKALRENTVLPAFRRAAVVFGELNWFMQQDASNGSATLRLAEKVPEGMKVDWRYILSLKPNITSQKVEIHTIGEYVDCKSLNELTASEIDRIITEFAKLAEEDLQESKLPR